MTFQKETEDKRLLFISWDDLISNCSTAGFKPDVTLVCNLLYRFFTETAINSEWKNKNHFPTYTKINKAQVLCYKIKSNNNNKTQPKTPKWAVVPHFRISNLKPAYKSGPVSLDFSAVPTTELVTVLFSKVLHIKNNLLAISPGRLCTSFWDAEFNQLLISSGFGHTFLWLYFIGYLIVNYISWLQCIYSIKELWNICPFRWNCTAVPSTFCSLLMKIILVGWIRNHMFLWNTIPEACLTQLFGVSPFVSFSFQNMACFYCKIFFFSLQN